VLQRIHQLKKEREVICLRGNHEVMMLEARRELSAIIAWLQNGGDETLSAYGAKTLDAIPDKDWRLIESTLPYERICVEGEFMSFSVKRFAHGLFIFDYA
jgi:serine/threonine protein phosphatase 1